ncbi:MAG: GNAT family N-acetyltransferase [Thermomicrobiales bacterium]|nr:GNAT family N-acetyltransferase [Thermomicrobiales bacterium]
MSDQIDRGQIAFRWMTEDDLPLMHRWLNEGPSFEWYGLEPTTLLEVVRAYEPRLHGRSDVLSVIATYDGTPVGYVQRYFTRDHADFWGHQNFPEDTAGIDLFIGEPGYLHRGLGPRLIRAFLRTYVFAGQAGRCIIDPDPKNAVAIRAYEKVGFRYLRTIGPPVHEDEAYLMVLEASDFHTPGALTGLPGAQTMA